MTETQARPEDVADDRLPASVSRALVPCDVPLDLEQRIRLADAISRASVLPMHLRGKPQNVLAICFAAHSLQIPLWPAITEMFEVKGKIGISANLMRALWLRAGHDIRFTERTVERCTVVATRRGGEPYELTFTVDDAIRAGLCWRDADGVVRARSDDNKPTPWETYTIAMLVARATSAVLREVGADVLLGCNYTAEELGAADFTEDGGVHVVTAVAESDEQREARVQAAQDAWDEAVVRIEAATSEAALLELWHDYNRRGLVRVPFEGATLEQVIIARRERLMQDAAAEATKTSEREPEAVG